jgi:hypothetical protein
VIIPAGYRMEQGMREEHEKQNDPYHIYIGVRVCVCVCVSVLLHQVKTYVEIRLSTSSALIICTTQIQHSS